MSSNTEGFKNEDTIANYLNNKRVSDLNDNMKKFVKSLFREINDSEYIVAKKGKKGQKPDLEISCNGITKGVSVKIGKGNSVHQENVYSFINFLTTLGVSDKTKEELLKFHWADGTIDGTGAYRMEPRKYIINHKEELNLVNIELNNSQKLIPILERILFVGKDDTYKNADYVYYGDVNEGYWASREEIINYILQNNFICNRVHFGPLNYQIWNSCLNYNPKTEDRRNTMQVKWGSLLKDLLIIMKEREENE